MNYLINISKHANRALRSIIAKSKSLGGLLFKCFSKLYDSLVLPILTYGAAIWGHRSYSCINFFYRTCRFYLGVGKYSPNAAVQRDIGWKSPWHQQWICIFINWSRLCDMSDAKLCKFDQIFDQIFETIYMRLNALKLWNPDLHELVTICN